MTDGMGIVLYSPEINRNIQNRKMWQKAGTPCQDPPLELQIQYTVNMRIGETLVKDGCLLSVCGRIARLLYKLMLKKGTGNRTPIFSFEIFINKFPNLFHLFFNCITQTINIEVSTLYPFVEQISPIAR